MKSVVKVPSHCHSLKAENLEEGYICDGCQERGVDWRYTCSACNYDMHSFCARPPPSIPHPLTGSQMKLLSTSVVRDSLWCSACERSVLGLRYSCTASREVLHPCCAHLPKTQAMGSHTLLFSKNLSTEPCNSCGKRTRGWAYVSKDYSIHVHCLKEGLIEENAQEFNSSSLQLQAAPSTTSYHQHSRMVYPPLGFNDGFTATPGTVQIYKPLKSKHGFKAFCRKSKLFFKALRARMFGDPSSTLETYMTFAAHQ